MTTLRAHLDGTLAALRNDRQSWWLHWRELAEFILPRRYRWLVQPNQMNRGSQINQRIIDSTGTIAARTLASGMMSGVTSPTRPWFKLQIAGFANDESHPISIWLSECEKRMLRVFAESNFYNAMAVMYHDLIVFGTAPVIIYEDFENVIRCFNPCAGEYFVQNSSRLEVTTFYREFILSAGQLAEQFGKEKLPEDLKQSINSGQGGATREVTVAHAIEPNLNDGFTSVDNKFKYREIYWIPAYGSNEDTLSERGFFEFPVICPRWDLTSNDAYGRSPGMEALPDIKQLQQETKRKAQAIDKMVNPPMIADVELKNQPSSLLPGAVTYVTRKDGAGFKPVFEQKFPIQEISADIQEIQQRIQRIFFNDIFMMFQNLEAEPRSAAAVDVRREEKLIMLGPVLERLENEALDKSIDRVFNIMLRAGLLPPAPQEIQDENIEISYVSMLAEAQRAVASAGLERLFGFAGNLAAVKPAILDNLDEDEAIAVYADHMAVNPRVVRSRETVAQIRGERAKKEQAAQQQQMLQPATDAAKTLSETDVGGGINALQAVMGNTVQ